MATSVAPLVEKRIRSFGYLREVFAGSRHWVSIASLGNGGGYIKEDGLEETQALRWFYLGISASTLLQHPAGAPFLRALLQLLEEHQYHFASSTAQSIKAIRARGPRGGGGGGGGGGGSSGGGGGADDKEVIAPALQRVQGKVLYEYLLTPHLAHALSGVQVRVARPPARAERSRSHRCPLARSPSLTVPPGGAEPVGADDPDLPQARRVERLADRLERRARRRAARRRPPGGALPLAGR